MAVAFTQPQVPQASAVPASVAPALFIPTEQKLVTAKQTLEVAEVVLGIQVAKQVQVLVAMVDQELSWFARPYQTFQHQTSMPPPTQEPQQTTSLKQPRSPLRAQHLLDPLFSCLLTESQLVAPA